MREIVNGIFYVLRTGYLVAKPRCWSWVTERGARASTAALILASFSSPHYVPAKYTPQELDEGCLYFDLARL